MKSICKNIFCFFSLSYLSLFPAYATHIVAGEITYRNIGSSGLTYEINIIIYHLQSLSDSIITIHLGDGDIDSLIIVNDTVVAVFCNKNIQRSVFQITKTYAAPGSYLLSAEIPNRIDSIVNIPNSVNVPLYLQSLLVIDPFIGLNSSPVFNYPPLDNAQLGLPFIYNPFAVDADGDSLSYELIPCLNTPGYFYPPASTSFSMNAVNGDLIWDTPLAVGYYSAGFLVKEWRSGQMIGSVYRDMMISICPTVGIEENNFSSEITIFPNPTSGQFTLSAFNSSINNIAIYNALGEKIHSQKITSPKTEINLSTQPNGIYFVQLRNSEQTVARKIILSK